MKNRLKNSINSKIKVAAALVVIILIVAVLVFLDFSKNIEKYAADSSELQLRDFSEHDAEMARKQIMSGVKMLQGLASNFAHGTEDMDGVLRILREELSISEFQAMYITDTQGNGIDGNGESVEITNNESYEKVMSGEIVIEAVNDGMKMNREFINIGVPIIEDGKVSGAVYGKYDAFTISELIEMNSFQSESYAVIIDKNGDYIINTNSDKALNVKCSNIFSYLKNIKLDNGYALDKMKKAMDSDSNALMSYGTAENGRVASIVPIGINEWYIMKVVTYNQIAVKSNSIRRMVTILTLKTILILFAISCIVIYVLRESHRRKNELLTAALTAANSATEAKGMFLAQMSHEIRTPMNAIIGLTNIAKMDVKDEVKMSEYLDKIDGASKILLGIINDVLDMSAMENNKMQLANVQFDLKELISGVTNVYYQQCRQKGIEYEVKMNNIVNETLVGDSLRVNQILYNLLNNAVKFTPSGGRICLRVEQYNEQNDRVHMRFAVKDTGCGMTEEMLERLFKPFEQESATTARKYGGSGLGLSIVKNLSAMMNGTVDVKSKKDEGTEFIVDIPFEIVEKTEEQLENNKEILKKIKALVVDDSEDALKYMSVLLERLNVQNDCATTGEEALEKIGEADDEGEPYTLCMVDWKMPGMNGVELTEQIRDIFGDDTIIMIMSAYDLDEIEAEGRKAGVNYFMPKPLFQSTLFDILMELTDGKYSQQKAISKEAVDYKLSGKRILVAEDVALNMEVAIKLLNIQGMTAECAEDGSEAVKMFENHEAGYYDAILMDINMPVMDGYEATAKIRSSEKADAKIIPIFAMTANAFSEDVSRSFNAGMNGHIAKPIETKALYETLSKALCNSAPA